MIIFVIGITSLIGLLIGYHSREIVEKLNLIIRKFETQEPKVGATKSESSDKFTYEYASQNPNSAIVEPKSPTLIKWEEEEELKQQNLRAR